MPPTFQELQQRELAYIGDHHDQNEPRPLQCVGAAWRHWRGKHQEGIPEDMVLELNLEEGWHFHR